MSLIRDQIDQELEKLEVYKCKLLKLKVTPRLHNMEVDYQCKINLKLQKMKQVIEQKFFSKYTFSKPFMTNNGYQYEYENPCQDMRYPVLFELILMDEIKIKIEGKNRWSDVHLIINGEKMYLNEDLISNPLKFPLPCFISSRLPFNNGEDRFSIILFMKILSELLMFHCRLDVGHEQLTVDNSYHQRGQYILALYESVPWLLDEKLDTEHSIILNLKE